ncbi:MAG TPA: hypothetical protein VEB20_24930 [Azospirillaceae bacterium]|nr:hypothetical protein [Azospirillaceae bacterium]
MPIRRETRFLYPVDWEMISRRIRFQRAKGRCEACGRPHGSLVSQLADGRWFDEASGTWRDDQGRPAGTPDLVELSARRAKQVRLAACPRNHEPWDCQEENLVCLCGRCHLRQDREFLRRQRRLTFLRRRALGDLFLGGYPLI